MKALWILVFSFCLLACAGRPPFLEYTIAKTALKSARKVNAEKNTGAYWYRARDYYQQGRRSFRERDYKSAERFFNESIKWAEKAENFSRFKMSKGEGI